MIFRTVRNDYKGMYQWDALIQRGLGVREADPEDEIEVEIQPETVIEGVWPPMVGAEVSALSDIVCLTDWLSDITPHIVRMARENGPASWSEIGQALGMSKQAAQQKFGGVEPADQS